MPIIGLNPGGGPPLPMKGKPGGGPPRPMNPGGGPPIIGLKPGGAPGKVCVCVREVCAPKRHVRANIHIKHTQNTCF
jgi:hypothetical protein